MLLKKTITPIYRSVNLTQLQKEEIPDADIQFLQQAYKYEKQKLELMLGVSVPWQ